MKRIKRLAICLTIVGVGLSSTQCFPEDDMVTVCYYGVTQVVSKKIAKRYVKVGATMGACGSQPDLSVKPD